MLMRARLVFLSSIFHLLRQAFGVSKRSLLLQVFPYIGDDLTSVRARRHFRACARAAALRRRAEELHRITWSRTSPCLLYLLLHRPAGHRQLPHRCLWVHLLERLLHQAIDPLKILKSRNLLRRRRNGFSHAEIALGRSAREGLWRLRKQICHQSTCERL